MDRDLGQGDDDQSSMRSDVWSLQTSISHFQDDTMVRDSVKFLVDTMLKDEEEAEELEQEEEHVDAGEGDDVVRVEGAGSNWERNACLYC